MDVADGAPTDWVYLRLPKVEAWLRCSAFGIGIVGSYLAVASTSMALPGWLVLTMLLTAGLTAATIARQTSAGSDDGTRVEITALRFDLRDAARENRVLRDSLAAAGVEMAGLRGQASEAATREKALAAAANASKRDLEEAIHRLTAAEAEAKTQHELAAKASGRASDNEKQLTLLRSEVSHLRELLTDRLDTDHRGGKAAAALAKAEARAEQLAGELESERSRVRSYACRAESAEETESLLAKANEQIARLERTARQAAATTQSPEEVHRQRELQRAAEARAATLDTELRASKSAFAQLASLESSSAREVKALRAELERVQEQLEQSALPQGRATTAMSLALFVEGDHDRIVLGELFGERLQAAGVHLVTLGGIDEAAGVLWGARVLQRTGVPVAILADHTDPTRVRQRKPRTKEEYALVDLCNDAEGVHLEIDVFGLCQPDIIRYLDEAAMRERCARFVDWTSAERAWREAGSPTPWKQWFSAQFGLELNASTVASLVRETRSRQCDLGDLQAVVEEILAKAGGRPLRLDSAAA